jgi:hypothetical protein
VSDQSLPPDETIKTIVRSYTEAELALTEIAGAVAQFRSASDQLSATSDQLGAATTASEQISVELERVVGALDRVAGALEAIDPTRLWAHLERIAERQEARATRIERLVIVAVLAGILSVIVLVSLASGILPQA